MSSHNVDQAVKHKLAKLLAIMEPVVDNVLSDMSAEEIQYCLEHLAPYLKLDLKHYFEKHRQARQATVADFHDIFTQE